LKLLKIEYGGYQEANRIGVGLMDQAGYNPIEAIEFWKRMKQRREVKQFLVYLSTHPADDKRIAEIEKILQDQKTRDNKRK